MKNLQFALLLFCSIGPLILEAQEKKILVFDLYLNKTDIPESLGSYLSTEMKRKLSGLDCINVPTDEEREMLVKEAGVFVMRWDQNQRTAQSIVRGVKVDGYITMALVDKNTDQTAVSIVYHENGKALNYWTEDTDKDKRAILEVFERLLSNICQD
jgi:hypothetical protein